MNERGYTTTMDQQTRYYPNALSQPTVYTPHTTQKCVGLSPVPASAPALAMRSPWARDRLIDRFIAQFPARAALPPMLPPAIHRSPLHRIHWPGSLRSQGLHDQPIDGTGAQALLPVEHRAVSVVAGALKCSLLHSRPCSLHMPLLVSEESPSPS